MTRLLLSRRSAIGHDDPERAIGMAMRAVTATLEQRNAFDVAGVAALRVRDEELSAELLRMVKAYLVIA